MDGLVFDLLVRWCDAVTVPTTVAPRAPAGADPLAKLVELERRASDAAEMFAAGEITRDMFGQASAQIEQRRAALEVEVAEYGRAVVPTWLGRADELRREWSVQAVGWRRAVVESTLAGPIVVAPSAPGATRFMDDRVSVTWRS